MLGSLCLLSACGRKPCEEPCYKEERCSGPLSDRDTKWDKEDYGDGDYR